MKKILVVDDEDNVRKLYSEEFGDMGYKVYEASGGEEAIQLFKKEKPNVVILDMRMPGMDGLEVLIALKNIDSSVPVIISSAYEEYKHDLSSWLSDAYVVKSCDMEHLRDTVKGIFEKGQGNLAAKQYPEGQDADISELVKKLSLLSNKTNIEQYGLRIKKILHDLKSSLNNISALLSNLSKQLTDEHEAKALDYANNAVMYSILVLNNYSYIFSIEEPGIAKANIESMIDEVIKLSTTGRRYTINQSNLYREDVSLNFDVETLRMILFVLFRNIHDYLMEDDGYISVEVSKEMQEPMLSIRVAFAIAESREKSGRKKTVMVVDDDANIQQLLTDSLAELRYEVITASDGYECLDMIREQTIDIIVLDLKMVGMEGLEVLKTIRRNRKYLNMPVIIYSASYAILEKNFNDAIVRFNPVRTVLKKDDLRELTLLISEMIKIPLKRYLFKDLYDLDLENSIAQDAVFRTGFYSVKKGIERLGGTLRFSEVDDENIIVIELPLTNTVDLDDKKDRKEQYIRQIYLQDLNDCIRHDLKNKLLPIQRDINKLTTSKVHKNRQQIVNKLSRTINECVKLLDRIK